MKTVICDIDGTILEYVKGGHYDLVYREAKLLLMRDRMGSEIVEPIRRRESVREVTERALRKAGIPFDMLIMGFADTGRVLKLEQGKVKATL